MIVVADSGSTKADWMIINGEAPAVKVRTSGINPMLLDQEGILRTLMSNPDLQHYKNSILHVEFYGAGCASDENPALEYALGNFFSRAEVIIDNDLMLAAKVAYSGFPLLVGILGTGTNFGFYDGESLTQLTSSLGYILGDEGSGAYFGREFIRGILYGSWNKETLDAFQYKYQESSRVDILKRVYQGDRPNKYLASFMPFIASQIHHDDINQMVMHGYHRFAKRHLEPYLEKNLSNDVVFVGSVAQVFQDQIKEVLNSYNVNLQGVIRRPLEHYVSKKSKNEG